MASASTRRPSASVLPISTVMPLRLVSTSPGRKALPAMLLSAAGISTRSRTGSFARMARSANESAAAAPPMSFFIRTIALDGLISRPPVSKQIPLPTIVTLGARSEPQRRSIRRGARSLARPTAWIIGKLSESRPEPSVTLTLPPKAVASSRAALSSSAGPRSFAGVLIRSRPK